MVSFSGLIWAHKHHHRHIATLIALIVFSINPKERVAVYLNRHFTVITAQLYIAGQHKKIVASCDVFLLQCSFKVQRFCSCLMLKFTLFSSTPKATATYYKIITKALTYADYCVTFINRGDTNVSSYKYNSSYGTRFKKRS